MWWHVADGPGTFSVTFDQKASVAFCDEGVVPDDEFRRIHRYKAGTEEINLNYGRSMFVRDPVQFTVEQL